jgi:hypothetical protein
MSPSGGIPGCPAGAFSRGRRGPTFGAMSSLTRWVLAHKRTAVLTWLALTIAGAVAAGPASNALDPQFSVPDK